MSWQEKSGTNLGGEPPAPGAVFLLVAVGALAVALSLPRGATPGGREVGPLLAGASLAEDGDLDFGAADLARGYRLWPQGPAGLRLTTASPVATEPALDTAAAAPPRFAEPWVPTVLVALVWPLFGGGSGALLGTLLALAIGVALGGRSRGSGWPVACAAATLLPFLAASGDPLLLPAAAAAGAVALARPATPRRLILAGVLTGVAAWHEPRALVLAGVLLVLAVQAARRSAVAWILVGALAGFVGMGLGQRGVTGSWNGGGFSTPAAGATLRVYTTGFPGEVHKAAEGRPWEAPRAGPPRTWPVEARDLFLGRTNGLLLLAPGFLLAAAVGLARAASNRRGAARSLHVAPAWTQAAGLIAFGAFEILAPQEPGRAGILALAPAWTALVWPRRGSSLASSPASETVPAAADPAGEGLSFRRAGSWVLALLLAAIAGAGVAPLGLSAWAARVGERAAVEPPVARLLPLELGAVDRLPGYALVSRRQMLWAFPTATSYPEERNAEGVWLKGASRVHIVLVSPGDLPSIELRLAAISPRAEVEIRSTAGRRRVVFDSEAKREGVSVVVPLPPIADERDRGRFFAAGERYYRLVVEVSDGAVARRGARRSTDGRYLGVFLGLPE